MASVWRIVNPASTDWQTPTEKSAYRTTPDYAETMAYLHRIAAAAPNQVKIEPFGTTGEGRELDIVIASKDGDFDPERIHASHRPIVLVQNAIHAGEMDGKDACLALLRDMVITKSQAALLDNAVFVLFPCTTPTGTSGGRLTTASTRTGRRRWAGAPMEPTST